MSEPMTYEQFGIAFVEEAVTEQRIISVVRSIAGDVVEVGPIAVGPGAVAQAMARGSLGTPTASRTAEDPLSYQLELPVDLDLDVDVGGKHHRFGVTAVVMLRFTVHLERPLCIVISPDEVTKRDVSVKVNAHGLQAKMIGKVGDIDNELKRQIAAYVRERIDADSSEVTSIDLRPLMQQAWPAD